MQKKDIAYPILVFLSWRLIIFLIQPQNIFASWTTYWDAGHYLSIAREGYNFPQQAFFPFWPFLIKIVSLTGLSAEISMYILTLFLGLSSFILFYLLAKKITGSRNAKLSLLLFAAFPSTMFLHAGYTEGLFLTLTMLSFYLMEKKKLFLASLTAGLSGMTRLVGVVVSIAFFIRNRILRFFAIGLSGLIIYMLYLYLTFGDPLIFVHAQQNWCESSGRCQLTFPLRPLADYYDLLLSGSIDINPLSTPYIDWISGVIFLSLLWVVWKKLENMYFIYSLLVISIPLMSGSTVGMVRYILAAFPIFFVIPSLIKSRLLFFVLIALLFLLQLRFVTLFTSRGWVA